MSAPVACLYQVPLIDLSSVSSCSGCSINTRGQAEYRSLQLAIDVDNHDGSTRLGIYPVNCVGNVVVAILTNVVLQVGNRGRNSAVAVLVIVGGISEQDHVIIVMIEGDCSLRSRSNVLVELLVAGSCEVSSAVQLRVIIAVQNNAGSSLVGVVVYCVDVDLCVTLNSAVQRVLDYVAANNSVAVLGPNLEFLRTVPDLVYMVISLISVGRLSSLEYVTVVNVGAALDAVVAEVNINNLSVVYAVGLVSQYGGSKYRGFLPIAQGLASDNLEAVSLVANEYGSVFVDCLNRTLNQLVVLNMVVANLAGEYVVVSRVAAVANNLQLVLVAGLGVGYDRSSGA